MFTSPVTHILPVATIRRTRLLPAPGKVLVRKGQKVDSGDVIAEALVSPEHLLLEVARGLGISASKADAIIERQVGETVVEGDVIAGPVGFGRRIYRAPKAGRVVLVGGGQVLLELNSRPFELKAGIPGVVMALVDEFGAQIETSGALVQGVWGNRRSGVGLLQNLARSPKDLLSRDRLDVSHRGAVVMGAVCQSGEVLEMAAEIPLRGLILASIPSSLIPLAEKMPYPIILTEGFGELPMSTPAYRLLTTNEKREAVLAADAWDRLDGTRPEIIIPLPTSGAPFPVETDVFSPGQQVRVLSPAQRGTVGEITALPSGLAELSNGVRAYAAQIRLESGEEILLPLANIEVLK